MVRAAACRDANARSCVPRRIVEKIAQDFREVRSIQRHFKGARNIRRDPPIVLDHQNAHHSSLMRSIAPLRAST
jgi:hypothetical protein